MSKKVICLLLMSFFILQTACNGNSIWAKRNQTAGRLYADDVARNIGDILTILISEVSDTDFKTERNLNKSTARSIDFDGQIGGFANIGDLGIQASSSNTLDGSAEFGDRRRFTDAVTVVVMDIMPNGNLVVLGSRERDISGDTQVIEISGIVRPSDINFNNTIASNRVANFNIYTASKGISQPYTEPGWLGGIFDFIWPF